MLCLTESRHLIRSLLIMNAIDPDDELTAWHEMQESHEPVRHRCPPDMPPCPQCEELIEEEQFKEFGAS